MGAPSTRRRRLGGSLLLTVGVVACGVACAPDAPAGEVRVVDGAVEVPARVNAAGFARGEMAGYHAVVWRGGRAADAALFQAEVTDLQVLDAMERLGAVPGDGLDVETWEHRHDPASDAADEVIAGPPVEILVRLPGREAPVPFLELLEDPGGRGLEMRFGGHRAVVPEWRSGCVVCLYSCPGSKVGNAAYTVRDFARGTTRFRVKEGVLPPDGTPVTVVLRPVT